MAGLLVVLILLIAVSRLATEEAEADVQALDDFAIPDSALVDSSELYADGMDVMPDSVLLSHGLDSLVIAVDSLARGDSTETIPFTESMKTWRSVVGEMCRDTTFLALRVRGVEIDCYTGALVVRNDRLTFGVGEIKLREEGKELLREVVPKYLAGIEHMLGDERMREHVERIEVSGYADPRGSPERNYQLTNGRAIAVLDFLLSDRAFAEYRVDLARLAVGASYGEAERHLEPDCRRKKRLDPNTLCDGVRRVEVRLRLDEAKFLREFMETLDGNEVEGLNG